MAKLLYNIIWEAFQWVALFGGVLGLVTGVALIVNSALVFRVAERMNRWISTRQALRPLEEPIPIERAIYRSHRLIGTLLLAGAVFTLYVLVLRLKGPELVFLLRKFFGAPTALWLADSLRLFLIVVNVAAALVAATMVLRPSALKGLEDWANRRYSGRRATRMWEIPRTGADPIVQAYPRLVGAFLGLAGLYVLLAIGYVRWLA